MSDRPSKQKLSCPFCGGQDIRAHHRGHPTSGEWVIECHSCSCELTGFASEQDAWKTWNGRWNPTPVETTDDAPELTEADFDRAIFKIGGKQVSRDEWVVAARAQVEPKPPRIKPGDRVQNSETGSVGVAMTIGSERAQVQYDDGRIREPPLRVLLPEPDASKAARVGSRIPYDIGVRGGGDQPEQCGVVPPEKASGELPDALRDPIKAMKRGSELLESWGPTPVTDAALAAESERCSQTFQERRCALASGHEGNHKYPGGRYS